MRQTGSLSNRVVQIANLCQEDLLPHLGNVLGIPCGHDHLKYRFSLQQERTNEDDGDDNDLVLRRECSSNGWVIEILGCENKSGPRFHRDEKRPSQRDPSKSPYLIVPRIDTRYNIFAKRRSILVERYNICGCSTQNWLRGDVIRCVVRNSWDFKEVKS